MSKRNIILIILVVILLVVCIFFGKRYRHDLVINRESKFEDIVLTEEKINVYVFWGSTCSVCEELFKFLEGLSEKYTDLIQVYAFEVWDNEDNAKLMAAFLENYPGIGEAGNTPYTIIGNSAISGFSANKKETILETILSEYENRNFLGKSNNVIRQYESNLQTVKKEN